MSTSELAIDRLAPTRRPVDQRVVMYQSWRSLLFMHWTFPPEVIRPLLPSGLGLVLDTYGGRAYVGLVPFTMRGVRPKGLPAVPWLSNFPETNVRTYVHFEGRRSGCLVFQLGGSEPDRRRGGAGLVFSSLLLCAMRLDARLVADRLGRLGGTLSYHSERIKARPVSATTTINAHVLPDESRAAVLGTLEHFLLERYLLYAVRGGRLYSGQVHHTPYPFQSAEVDAFDETLLAASGIAQSRREADRPLFWWGRRRNLPPPTRRRIVTSGGRVARSHLDVVDVEKLAESRDFGILISSGNPRFSEGFALMEHRAECPRGSRRARRQFRGRDRADTSVFRPGKLYRFFGVGQENVLHFQNHPPILARHHGSFAV